MQLQEKFIYTAKQFAEKVAFIDRFSERKVTYKKALIASIVLSRKIRSLKEKLTGIMIPTSAGAAFFNYRNFNGRQNTCDD